MNVIDFIRDIGRYYRLNNLLAKDSIASRLAASADGLSFTEFSYTLLQGYDYEKLFLEKVVVRIFVYDYNFNA
jgi:tyrosyl-tRNA synthetase